jgi:adenylate kinase family enzyme
MEANYSKIESSQKRIVIFGIPGSGKSTFALKLSVLLNLPLFHLDKYFFVQGWKERDYEEFLQIQKGLVDQDCYIMDGNAIRSLEMRFHRADIIIYFRFNRLLCLWRIFKRWIWKDQRIDDRAEGCSETICFSLIRYLWQFPKRVKQSIEGLHLRYPNALFYEFSSDKQASAFLIALQKQKICL